jgi:hypothetical protein
LDLGRIDFLLLHGRERPWEDLSFGPWLNELLRNQFDDHPPATADQIRAGIGFTPVLRFTRGSQWVEIYLKRP